ncbi:O-antigen ligase family protein [Cyanobium sp. ATX 6F1]|uniref:O-antigen ligase family protein n=1 Tax=unclassified Cyanobium TaxID=2627006 RepID=UPI0020CBBEDC|nr:O-antigen ligase family protein [Cyanobium sp. ATX 6F1]MCP9916700.1 O-antigen ligase family protein [Cyanobium sp. ATX 6F1]
MAAVAGAAAFQLTKNQPIRLLIGLGTLLYTVMVLGTQSRAGLGLIPITLIMGWALRHGAMKRHWKTFRLKGPEAAVLAGTSIVLLGVFILRETPQIQELTKAATELYGEENLISDQGRIDLWRCYASLPFSGNNRFLFGAGYGKARQLCQIFLPGHDRPLTHAHNLPLQIWAKSGTLPLAALLVALATLGLRLWRRLRFNATITGLTALFMYALLFNLLELGMLKVRCPFSQRCLAIYYRLLLRNNRS